MVDSMQTSLGRYEVRDYAVRGSKKKFHVWDRKLQREVFHTNNRERADALVAAVGDGDITQHFKDYGHYFKPSGKPGIFMGGACARCKR